MRVSGKFGVAVAAAVVWPAAGAGSARAGFVTFTADATGSRPNGFFSVESSEVSFTDTLGADLSIGTQGIGQALGVFGDDASALLLNFTSPQTSLSLVFGNDDPGFSLAGDVGLLTLFNGMTQVGQVSVVLNRDDIANQTISFSGAAFTSATFVFARPVGATFVPIDLIEIVDNIAFDNAGLAAVPEPASAALLAAGAVGLAGRRLVRRRAA